MYKFTDYSLDHIHRELLQIKKTNQNLIDNSQLSIKVQHSYNLTHSLIASNTLRSHTAVAAAAIVPSLLASHSASSKSIHHNENNISSINNINYSDYNSGNMEEQGDTIGALPTIKPKIMINKTEYEMKKENLVYQIEILNDKFDQSIRDDYLTLARPLSGSPNTKCCCIFPWSNACLSWSRTNVVRFFLKLWILVSCSLAFVLWIEFFGNWLLEVCPVCSCSMWSRKPAGCCSIAMCAHMIYN